jgi:hypothetical protein
MLSHNYSHVVETKRTVPLFRGSSRHCRPVGQGKTSQSFSGEQVAKLPAIQAVSPTAPQMPERVSTFLRCDWSYRPHTVARVLDGDIVLLGVLAVAEGVGLGKRDRRRCYPDQGEMGDGHGNYCHSSRLCRDVRKMHRSNESACKVN